MSRRMDYSVAFDAPPEKIYQDFTSKVAEGRTLPMEDVLEVAQGRVWSGEDAKRLSLVDELGGFRQAIALVREAAGIDPDATLRLRVFPERKPFWQRLLERGSPSGEVQATVLSLRRVVELAQPLFELSRRVGLLKEEEVLRMEQELVLPD